MGIASPPKIVGLFFLTIQHSFGSLVNMVGLKDCWSEMKNNKMLQRKKRDAAPGGAASKVPAESKGGVPAGIELRRRRSKGSGELLKGPGRLRRGVRIPCSHAALLLEPARLARTVTTKKL